MPAEPPDSRAMMMRVFCMILAMLTAPFARAETLVFAAASLKEPLDELADAFGDVTVSYGGSSTLARQVSFGAPADLVLLANVDWMDVLQADGFVQSGTVSDFASNALVLIGPAEAGDVLLHSDGIALALGDGRLAIGLTEAVPAGIYGKAALEHLNLWEHLSGRLAEVDNVRSAMALVARKQAPLGIVYATDARASDDVRVVARFPTEAHPPIRYVGALRGGADAQAAAFWAFVKGSDGQVVLQDSGFLPPQQGIK
jgi:molybdate transport system substrate-binding protein